MIFIIAGYHTNLESWQGNTKKEVLHKYIFISNNWNSILKFYHQGIDQCANYFFYYLVEIDKPFDLRTPTHKFNVRNAHQMPKTLATHYFDELVSQLKKPSELENIDNETIGHLYFCYNSGTQEAFLSQQAPENVLKKYEEQKKSIFLKSFTELKKAIHEMVSYQDFYLVENIVRRHEHLIEQVTFKSIQLQLDKTVCLNQIMCFNQF